MKRPYIRSVKRIPIPNAATLLILATLASQVLGFLRTKLVNANFQLTGAQSTDVYFAAFKIPDFFFYIMAAGALSVAFIPILNDHIQRYDRRGVWKISSSLMNLMAIIMLGVGIFIFLFAPQLTHLVSPNLSAEQLNNAVLILRLIAFNPLFFTLAGVLTSVQQVYGRFFFFAFAPVVYNLAIILSIYVFRDSIGLVGLGIGALAGGVLQLMLAFLGVVGMNFKWYPIIDLRNKELVSVLKKLPARSIDQGVDSVNSIVETNRARLLGDGILSSYENAYVIHTAPILLLGQISIAAFPKLTERISQGRPDLFRKDFVSVLRVIIWLAIPITLIAFFGRGYLSRIIFSNNTPYIPLILGFLSFAIFFRSIYSLLSRYFYAHKDTYTPLIISLFAILLNIILAITLARSTTYGPAGLAIAQAVVSAVEVLIIGLVMCIRDRKILDKEFWSDMVKFLSVAGFTALSGVIMLSVLPLQSKDKGFFLLGTKLIIISAIILMTHLIMSWIFGIKEAKVVVTKVKNFVLTPVKVQ